MLALPDHGLDGSADSLSLARCPDSGFCSRVFGFYLGVRVTFPMALPGPHFRPFRLDPAGISKTLIERKAVRRMLRLDPAERFRSRLKTRRRRPALPRGVRSPCHILIIARGCARTEFRSVADRLQVIGGVGDRKIFIGGDCRSASRCI